MILTYRYKLAPTRAQYALLDGLCEQQRQLYNGALQERVEAWRKNGKSISKHDQFRSLTEIRLFDETYAAIPVALSRWTLSRVDDAFKGFFSRTKRGDKAGFPRFKGKYRWRSFGFAEWSGIRLIGAKLVSQAFAGSEGLKVRLHRPIPAGASIKGCSFTKTGRHWHVCLQVDAPGADEHIPNHRPRSRRERELRVAQRALARCKLGSKRRRKVRASLARVHRRIANARNTYLHEVSAKLASRYALIAVEKLKLKNMTGSARGTAEAPGRNVRQKAGLNRALLDAAPGKLLSFVDYKAERAGGLMEKYNAAFSSQDCSSCDARVPKALSERWHRCGCGVILHRDHNAARNMLNRAMSAHGWARPPGDDNVGRRPVRRLGNADVEAA